MNKVFLKPAKSGVIVRDPFLDDPETGKPRPLREDGELKTNSAYWRRRIVDGDVVIAEKETVKAKQPVTNSAKKAH